MRAASRQLVATAVMLSVLPAAPGLPCAVAPRARQLSPGDLGVTLATEEALIVWDPHARVQQFVRRAEFAGETGEDFGFLVPTPGRPKLEEAPDALFARLADAIKPDVVQRTRWRLEPVVLLLLPFFVLRSARPPDGGIVTAAPQAVRVLEQTRVAGLDAAVLAADDPHALLEWLKQHDYPARPALVEWLKPYVAQRWVVSAFKIAGDSKGAKTAAVRMTFETARPVFPYREPADQKAALSPVPRELRVYLVAPGRFDGRLGDAGRWPAELLHSAPLPAGELASLVTRPGPGGIPADAWLTAYSDKSRERPGDDDLFFGPSRDQAVVRPPPIVIETERGIPLPLDLMLGLAAGIWWRSRRARGSGSAAARSSPP